MARCQRRGDAGAKMNLDEFSSLVEVVIEDLQPWEMPSLQPSSRWAPSDKFGEFSLITGRIQPSEVR